MNLNKVCELEDFSDPELAAVMRDVAHHKLARLPGFPAGAEHRKDWEIAMAVLALRRFGALERGSLVLGVAAGAEDTLFYLTRHVRQVFATDRYLDAREWAPEAPMSLLVEPSAVAPYDFDPTRLVVQHMDARHLLYPDDTFDGIFSSGSIEHVGELIDVANVAYEMGRVLKPGGVLSLSTELRLSGPPGGIGWPGQTLVLSPENLRRYIVEASGLEPVDDLQTTISPATMTTRQSLNGAIEDRRERMAEAEAEGDHTDFACWTFPHLVLEHGGYELTSVHLTLRKTDAYPLADNDWAAPTASTLDAIRRHNLGLLARGAVPAETSTPTADPRPAGPSRRRRGTRVDGPQRSPAARYFARAQHIQAIDAHLAELDALVADVDRTLGAVDRQAEGVQLRLEQRLATPPVLDAPALSTGPPPAQVTSRARWTTSVVAVGGLEFALFRDPANPACTTEGAILAADAVVELLLELLQPGEQFVDLGAAGGIATLAAAALGCRVLAVERSAADAGRLRASAARNGFTEVRVIHAAAADAVRPAGRMGDDGAPLVVSDDLLAEFSWDPVALVRIGVGVGASTLAALRGLHRLMARPDAPPVLVEVDGRSLAASGVTATEILAELQGHGYTTHLVEPDRLVAVPSTEPLPSTVVDCLAWKQRPERLSGRPVEAITFDDRVSRLLADCRSSSDSRRAHVAGLLEVTDEAVLSFSEITDALDRLAKDPSDEVRAAAAWWASLRAGRAAASR